MLDEIVGEIAAIVVSKELVETGVTCDWLIDTIESLDDSIRIVFNDDLDLDSLE